MWMKYRHAFAYGYDDWQWRYLFTDDEDKAEAWAAEWSVELQDEYTWSEHYRGIRYEIKPNAPQAVIREQIAEAEGKIHTEQTFVDALQKLLK